MANPAITSSAVAGMPLSQAGVTAVIALTSRATFMNTHQFEQHFPRLIAKDDQIRRHRTGG
jgi:hypothetical protein